MATVGVVKAVSGEVTATDTRGNVRVLKPGDRVADNEVIKSANGGNAHIDFDNKGFATLGSGDTLTLSQAMLQDIANAGNESAPVESTRQSAADIEALQKEIQDALAKGEDPTQMLEAAAAGPGAGGAGGAQEGGNFVLVEQEAARGDLTPGFETGTFGYTFEDPQDWLGAAGPGGGDFGFSGQTDLMLAGNGEISVSEAHINRIGSGITPADDGIADKSLVTGTLALDYGGAGKATTGGFAWTDPDGADNTDHAAFPALKAMVNGAYADVSWSVSDDGLVLTGTAGGQTAMQLTMNADTGEYSVEVFTGLQHTAPDGMAADYNEADLPFSYTLKDAAGATDTGTLTVHVQDDALVLEMATTETSVYTDKYADDMVVDFSSELSKLGSNAEQKLGDTVTTENGTTHTEMSMDGVTISTGRVLHPDNLSVELSDQGGQLLLVRNYANAGDGDASGLGISDFAHNRGDIEQSYEVGYDVTTDQSEALIFDLGGKIANQITINFRSFYDDALGNADGNLGNHAYEKLTMAFYLNGELVDIKNDLVGSGQWNTFEAGREYVNLVVDDKGGFDKVVIFAQNDRDQSGEYAGWDNSDFFVKDAKFTYNTELLVQHAEGSIAAHDADGVASLVFADHALPEALALAGYTMDAGADHIKVSDAHDSVAYEVWLDAENGTWEYSQYQALPDGVENSDLRFAVEATDHDGDVTVGLIMGDTLVGGAAADHLYGNVGNDILSGGAGDNILVGGLGSDTFHFNSDSLTDKVHGDIIMDFKTAEGDRLDLSELIMGFGEDSTDIADALVAGGGTLHLDLQRDSSGNPVMDTDGNVTIVIGIDQGGGNPQTLAVVHTDMASGAVPMQGQDGSGGVDQAALLHQLLNDQQIPPN